MDVDSSSVGLYAEDLENYNLDYFSLLCFYKIQNYSSGFYPIHAAKHTLLNTIYGAVDMLACWAALAPMPPGTSRAVLVPPDYDWLHRLRTL